MAMEMHLRAQQKLTQRLQMSPQMYQTIEILQYPLVELRERIEQELTENPLLEIHEPAIVRDDLDDNAGHIIEGSVEDVERKKLDAVSDIIDILREEWDDYASRAIRTSKVYGDDEDPKMAALLSVAAPGESLQDHLMQQIRLMELEPMILAVVEVLINALDRRGYLPPDYKPIVGEVKKHLAEEGFEPDDEPLLQADDDDIEAARQVLWVLDPPGIGAVEAWQCLWLQLDRMSGELEIEKQIVSEYLEKLAYNKLPDIASATGVSLERVKQAVAFIRTNLNPKPGLLFDNEPPLYIMPDIIITERDGELDVALNESAVPRVRFNRRIMNMVRKGVLTKEEKEYIAGKKESGRWLLSAVAQRHKTLMRIAKAVAVHQKDFFIKGKLYLRPLLMKYLAEQLSVDVSIVSRAVRGKYVDCPQGIVALRELFTAGYTTDGGQEVSDERVKLDLKRMVDEEDKSKPFSDEAIAELFSKFNINISRRTITKYRKELGIPNTRVRKQY